MNPHEHADNEPVVNSTAQRDPEIRDALGIRKHLVHAHCHRMGAQPLVRILVAPAVALTLSLSAWADFTGKVVAVADGDTLTVLVDHRQVQVHLAEIDAPELKQPFGQQSRQSLADLCIGKDAVVHETGRERSGRTNGRVACSGTDAGAEQVRRGMAWVFKRRPGSASSLYFLEDTAQRSHEGLWAGNSPVPPWIWRQDRRRR